MFRFVSPMVRFFLFAVMIAAFVMAFAPAANAQCNSGVSTQQAQIQANQALVLQQTAAIAAQQTAARQQPAVPQRTVFTQPIQVSSLAPACATCQQTAQAPQRVQAAQPPQLVLTMPGSGTAAPPGRYVLGGSAPVHYRLAKN